MLKRFFSLATACLFLSTNSLYLPKSYLAPKGSFSIQQQASSLITDYKEKFSETIDSYLKLAFLTAKDLETMEQLRDLNLLTASSGFSKINQTRQAFAIQRGKSLKLLVPDRMVYDPKKIRNFIKVYKSLKRKIDAYRTAAQNGVKRHIHSLKALIEENIEPYEFLTKAIPLLQQSYFLLFILKDCQKSHYVLPGALGKDERFKELHAAYANNPAEANSLNLNLADLAVTIGRVLTILNNHRRATDFLIFSHKISGLPNASYDIKNLTLLNLIQLNCTEEGLQTIHINNGTSAINYNEKGQPFEVTVDWDSEEIDLEGQSGNYPKAYELIEKLIDKNPAARHYLNLKEILIRFMEAEDAFLQSDNRKVYGPKYEKVIELGKKLKEAGKIDINKYIQVYMAYAYFRLGEIDKSEQLLIQVAEIIPAFDPLYNSLRAKVAFALNKPAQAMGFLRQLIWKNPNRPYALEKAYEVFSYMGLVDEAFWAQELAFGLSGGDPQNFSNSFHNKESNFNVRVRLTEKLLASPIGKTAAGTLIYLQPQPQHNLYPSQMIPILKAVYKSPTASELAKKNAETILSYLEKGTETSFIDQNVKEPAAKKPIKTAKAQEPREAHWLEKAMDFDTDRVLNFLTKLRKTKRKSKKTVPAVELKTASQDPAPEMNEHIDKIIEKTRDPRYRTGVDNEQRAEDYYLICVLSNEYCELDVKRANLLIDLGIDFFNRRLKVPDLKMIEIQGQKVPANILFFRALARAIVYRITEENVPERTIHKINDLLISIEGFANQNVAPIKEDSFYLAQAWMFFAGSFYELSSRTTDRAEKTRLLVKSLSLMKQHEELLREQNPTNFYYYLFRIYQKLGKEEEAKGAARKLTTLKKPETFNTLFWFVYAYEALEEPDGVIKVILNYVKSAKDNNIESEIILVPLGNNLIEKGQLAAALAVLYRAHILAPDNAETLFLILKTLVPLAQDPRAADEITLIHESFLAANSDLWLKEWIPVLFELLEENAPLFNKLLAEANSNSPNFNTIMSRYLTDYDGDFQKLSAQLEKIEVPIIPKKGLSRKKKKTLQVARDAILGWRRLLKKKIEEIEIPKRITWLREGLIGLPEDYYEDIYSRIGSPISLNQKSFLAEALKIYLEKAAHDYPFLQDGEILARQVKNGNRPFSALKEEQKRPFIAKWPMLEDEFDSILAQQHYLSGENFSPDQLDFELMKKVAEKIINDNKDALEDFSNNSDRLKLSVEIALTILEITATNFSTDEKKVDQAFLQKNLIPLVIKTYLVEQSDFIGEEGLIQIENLISLLETEDSSVPNFDRLRERINDLILDHFSARFPYYSNLINEEDILYALYHPEFDWERTKAYFEQQTDISYIDLPGNQTVGVPLRVVIDKSDEQKPVIRLFIPVRPDYQLFLNGSAPYSFKTVSHDLAHFIFVLREAEIKALLKAKGLSQAPIQSQFGEVNFLEELKEWKNVKEKAAGLTEINGNLKSLYAAARLTGKEFIRLSQFDSRRDYVKFKVLRLKEDQYFIISSNPRTEEILSVGLENTQSLLSKFLGIEDYRGLDLLTILANHQAQKIYFQRRAGRFMAQLSRILIFENQNGFYEADLSEMLLKGLSFSRSVKLIHKKGKNGSHHSEEIAENLNLILFPYSIKLKGEAGPSCLPPSTRTIHLEFELKETTSLDRAI